MRVLQLAFNFQSSTPCRPPVPSCWQESNLNRKYGLRPAVSRIYIEQILGLNGEVRHG